MSGSPLAEALARCEGRLAIDVGQAAQLLGVDRSTLYELIRQDRFPSFKVRGRRKVWLPALVDWVERGDGAAPPPVPSAPRSVRRPARGRTFDAWEDEARREL